MSINRKSQAALEYLDKLIGSSVSLGRILEAHRLSEGITQSVLAKKLDISAPHLSQIENGIKAVTPERAQTFAKKLHLSQALFVRLALQDQLIKVGLKYKVSIEAA